MGPGQQGRNEDGAAPSFDSMGISIAGETEVDTPTLMERLDLGLGQLLNQQQAWRQLADSQCAAIEERGRKLQVAVAALRNAVRNKDGEYDDGTNRSNAEGGVQALVPALRGEAGAANRQPTGSQKVGPANRQPTCSQKTGAFQEASPANRQPTGSQKVVAFQEGVFDAGRSREIKPSGLSGRSHGAASKETARSLTMRCSNASTRTGSNSQALHHVTQNAHLREHLKERVQHHMSLHHHHHEARVSTDSSPASIGSDSSLTSSQRVHRSVELATMLANEGEAVLRSQEKEKHREQHWVVRLARSPKFDVLMGFVIVVNVIVTSLEVEYHGILVKPIAFGYCVSDEVEECKERIHLAEIFFVVMEQVFTVLFAAELLLRLQVEGCAYLKKIVNFLDAGVVLVSMLDSWVLYPLGRNSFQSVTILRLVRLVRLLKVLRVVRVMKAFKSLRLMVTAVLFSVGALAWSMTLLFVLELSGAILMARMLKEYIEDSSYDVDTREFLWKHFGTCARAFFSMFEIAMAPGGFIQYRRLWDDVGPQFSLFIMVYECLVTFAVIRVITAMFLKETLSASTHEDNEDLKETAKRREEYAALLMSARDVLEDSPGSHGMTTKELGKVLQVPRMQEWVEDLKLEPDAAERIFRALEESGEGLIHFSDFIEALDRMRGGPKSSDVVILSLESRALMEKVTKLEEVLLPHFQALRLDTTPGVDAGESSQGFGMNEEFEELVIEAV